MPSRAPLRRAAGAALVAALALSAIACSGDEGDGASSEPSLAPGGTAVGAVPSTALIAGEAGPVVDAMGAAGIPVGGRENALPAEGLASGAEVLVGDDSTMTVLVYSDPAAVVAPEPDPGRSEQAWVCGDVVVTLRIGALDAPAAGGWADAVDQVLAERTGGPC